MTLSHTHTNVYFFSGVVIEYKGIIQDTGKVLVDFKKRRGLTKANVEQEQMQILYNKSLFSASLSGKDERA